jgi:ABC-2 type transport system ATP-binding protein
VLVASHLMRELQDTADHVVVVGRGRVIADSSVADLIGRWGSVESAYLSLTRDVVDYRGLS